MQAAGSDSGRQHGAAQPSVLIADDDVVARRRVRKALEADRFEIVAVAGDTLAAVAAARREQPDICLIDLGLPGDGLQAISLISRAVPSTLIVVLAGAERSQDVVVALERGASGFLLKESGDARLASTLRAALAGEPAVSRAVVSRLVDEIRRAPARQLSLPRGKVTLTPREWEVGELLREGRSTAEIADNLAVSPVTVRRHVGLLVRKLGARDRDEAVALLRSHARR